jgi:hypothetical protein
MSNNEMVVKYAVLGLHVLSRYTNRVGGVTFVTNVVHTKKVFEINCVFTIENNQCSMQ